MLFGAVVEGELSVGWGDEVSGCEVGGLQEEEADVVGDVGSLVDAGECAEEAGTLGEGRIHLKWRGSRRVLWERHHGITDRHGV